MNSLKKNLQWYFLGLLFVATFFVWREVFALNGGTLKFYLLDVGQGDAIFIETPSGNQILIDGGPDKSVLRELGEVMPFYDRTIDLVILTHPHLDHVGGLVEVLKNYEVEKFMDSGNTHTIAEFGELESMLEVKNVEQVEARRGTEVVLGEGTRLSILAPAELKSGSNLHNNMVISRLSFGEVDFLLMGDAERPLEFFLLERGDDIASEVLKAGHHGSKTSSSQLFLGEVQPQLALISVGRKNKYGHPNQEVLDNLAATSAKILRTDLDGRIEIVSDGRSLSVHTLR